MIAGSRATPAALLPASAARVPRGPVRREERALAPDLTRGAMLLFIALANAAGVVFGGQLGAAPHPHGLERAMNLVMFTAVHGRAYPVFAVMFGYGLVQLARRQAAAGAPADVIRSVLVRRNAWLVVFGFFHAALLYFGDFLGAYGIVGMIASAALLNRGDRVYRAVLWVWAASLAYVLILAALVGSYTLGTSRVQDLQPVRVEQAQVPIAPVGSLVAGDYVTSMRERLAEWPAHTATVLPFITIVWLGMWAARHRLLENPRLRLLRWTAGAGLGIAVAGGAPLALVSAGALSADAPTVAAMWRLNLASGMFAGPGYVAAFGLMAVSVSARAPTRLALPIRAIAALGQRSLSGYLFQSVAWLVLLSPYTLALGERFGSPLLTAIAIAGVTWATGVVAAFFMDRRSWRGPAEAVLRRLTYGGRLTPVPAREVAPEPAERPTRR